MKKILTIFFSIALSTAVLGAANNGGGNSTGGSAAAQPNPNAGAFNRAPIVDETSVIVQLRSEPLSTYPATRPPPGRKIDFSSNVVRSYRAQLAAERNDFKRWLQSNHETLK
jgi:hypothetical protein